MTMSTASIPLSRDIALQRLRRELSRRWKPGDRLPPIKDLSKLLGTGQTNTHRAAQLLAAEGVLVTRTRHGTFVQRLPDVPPEGDGNSNLATAGKRVVLLTVANTSDRFMDPACAALRDVLQRAGMTVHAPEADIHYHVHDQSQLDAADALVLVQPSMQVRMANIHKPAVVITTSQEVSASVPTAHDVVSVDSEQGGVIAGQAMHRAGAESAWFVGHGPQRGVERYDMISETRLRGFEAGWGAPIPLEHRHYAGAYRVEHGLQAFARYISLPRRPDGVFCATDDLAVGFMYASVSHGLIAGRDFKLIGFDGQDRGRELLDGPLTTVQVPVRAMGRTAAELLLARLAEPQLPVRRVLLGCTLAEGATAPIPTHSCAGQTARTHP